jgi:nicotinate-nucleotide pyrophosphorylase
MEKYNGWANFDTWLVNVWLMNDESNYRLFQTLDVVEVEEMTSEDLENWFYYGDDEINFDNVNVQEIRESMQEHL